MFPPPALVPLVQSKFLTEHVTGEFRLLILVAPCWMEVPWLPTVLNILQDIPRHCCVVKDLIIGCFVRLGAQGSAISTFNHLGAQGYMLCRLWFSSSVFQALVGATPTSTLKVYQQCWKEWAGWCAWDSVPNNAISAPKLATFFSSCI